jgi:hypothetical protein
MLIAVLSIVLVGQYSYSDSFSKSSMESLPRQVKTVSSISPMIISPPQAEPANIIVGRITVTTPGLHVIKIHVPDVSGGESTGVAFVRVNRTGEVPLKVEIFSPAKTTAPSNGQLTPAKN